MVIIGILKQAGNARTQTDIEGEKEIINLAVVGSMNKSKYGDIDETYFTNELEKNDAEVKKSGNKFKVTFPSERQYTVDQAGNIKEKNPNALEISELNENASTYFGWDVINYAETLPEELRDTEWQLFYAGELDGETEERIYLISKRYVKNTQLPTVVKNGVEIEGAKPRAVKDSEYKAYFGFNELGIIPHYSGSSDIEVNMQKYNKDYFKDYASTNLNMKSVAYMLDTTTWRSFATSSKNYAEWAIGGPTIELLFTAYNKYSGTTYEADATSENGYKVRKIPENSFEAVLSYAILDYPYSVVNLTTYAQNWWIASPGTSMGTVADVMIVTNTGEVNSNLCYETRAAFRPLVLLNSDFTLEKTKDSNGNDAFKIVEQ